MSNEEISEQKNFFTEINFTEIYTRNLNKSKYKKKNVSNYTKNFIKSYSKVILFLLFIIIIIVILMNYLLRVAFEFQIKDYLVILKNIFIVLLCMIGLYLMIYLFMMISLFLRIVCLIFDSFFNN